MMDYKSYLHELSDSMRVVVNELAELVKKEVSTKGPTATVRVTWVDPNGKLDIQEWRIVVRGLPKCDWEDTDTRFIELIGIEGGGYGISVYVYAGHKDQCLAMLKSPAFIDKLQHSMIVCLEA